MNKNKMLELLGEKEEYGGRATGIPYGEACVQSNRGIMWASTLSQAVSLKNPDIPGVMSYGHNEVFQSFRCLEKDANKIVHVVEDTECNIKYIIYINKLGQTELKKVLPYEHSNENYGFKNIIQDPEKDTQFALQTSDFVGDEGIPSMFLDTNIIYASYRGVYEDAVLSSDVYAERASVIKLEPIQIIVSTSDFFRKLHDGEVIPKIGKKLDRDDNILIAYTRDFSSFIRGDLNKVKESDRFKVYSDGAFLSSIEIEYHNKVVDINNPFSKFIYSDLRTKQELYDFLKDDDNLATSARIFVSKFDKFLDNALQVDGDKVFLPNDMRITLNMAQYKPLSIGSKSMGRCGNKGVISDVRPQEQLPFIEEGGRRIYADLIRTIYTENNRNNPIQYIEQITNRISDMLYTLKCEGKLTKEILVEYYRLLNGKRMSEEFRLSDDTVEDMFDGVRLINIIDENQNNLYYTNYEEIQQFLDKHFGRRITTPLYVEIDGHKICVGDGFISREAVYCTKQTAEFGLSLYSDAKRNSFGNPSRDNAKKKYEALCKSTPISTDVNSTLQMLNVLNEEELGVHLDKDKVKSVNALAAYLQALGFNTTF